MTDGDRIDDGKRDGRLEERLAALVVDRSRLVVAVLLVTSLVLGAGVLFLEVETGFIEVGDLPEREAQAYVEANFTDDPGSGSVLVLVEGDDVVSQDAARRQVAAERRIVADDRVRTDPEDPPIAFANAVAAFVAYQIDSGDDNVSDEALQHRREMLERGNLTYGPGEMTHPPLERQASILERLGEDSYHGARRTVVDGGGDAFLGVDYEEGPANETIVVVPIAEPGPDRESHAGVQAIADEELEGDTRAFSGAQHTIELEQAIGDSLLLVGPLGFLFVLSVLWVAYRDPIDIALGGLGIALVLLWMFGFLGWTGIGFNQVFVAAPILVIGLSVDYMFHVVMRYREHADDGSASGPDRADRVRTAMTGALAGVGAALAIVSGTTILGFLSNLTSPVPTVREFGVIGAFSILSIFLVFAVLLPAVRVEIDRRNAARGSLDVGSAIGTEDRLGSLLAVPARVAWNAPLVVLAVALLTGVGSAYAATLLSPTAFSTFLPRDPQPWLYTLPEPFSPGDYHFLQTADTLQSVFGHGGRQGEVLVRGDVASTAALERVARGSQSARDSPILAEGSPGDPAVQSPLTAMEATAAENESFNRTLQAADTDDDGIPDRNVEEVYDELYRVAPERAGRFVHREDGAYRALLVRVSVRTGIRTDRMARELDGVAASIEGEGEGESVGGNESEDAGEADDETESEGRRVTATPASQSNVMAAGIQAIVDSIVVGIGTALVVVTAFVTTVFRSRHGSAVLGLVTAAPVTLAVAWLFGTMYALGLPLNEVTGLIATFTIALGVDYTIHVAERFHAELEDAPAEQAVVRTLQGTGGALFGSALTTGGAFALLLLAVFPPLQLFGAMMALTMLYAFVASVVVLPALLALWSAWTGIA